MDANCITKLRECKSFPEASRVLEANGMGRSATELLRLGFSVRSNQPEIFQNNLESVIQEMEEKKKEEELKEVDGGVSHDSTKVDGTDIVTDTEPEVNLEGADKATGEDQMKEMGGGYPGQMPGMQQQPPMQQPPMQQPKPPMQQMQYIKQIEASMRKMAAKITELEKNSTTPTALVQTSERPNFGTLASPVKETTGASKGTTDGQIQNRVNSRKHLQEVRSDIAQYNTYLHEEKVNSYIQ